MTLGVIASPVCLYLSLAELDLLSFDPAGDALKYLTVGTITSLVAAVGCGLALTALLRRQPRTRPLVALAVAFVAGPLLTLGGASLGLDAAQDTLRSDIGSSAANGAEEVAEELENEDVDFGPLAPFVQMLLDEGTHQPEED